MLRPKLEADLVQEMDGSPSRSVVVFIHVNDDRVVIDSALQGGDEEEETTRRYVTSWLDECFDLSTDSSTSSSSSSSDSDSSGEFKIEDLV